MFGQYYCLYSFSKKLDTAHLPLYDVTYLYFGLIGFIVTIVVGIIVSIITGESETRCMYNVRCADIRVEWSESYRGYAQISSDTSLRSHKL